MDPFFVTGATGFLGSAVISEILKATDSDIYVLVRAADIKAAFDRLENLWWDRVDMKDEIQKRIIPVPGDISQPNLGISAPLLDRLSCCIRYIVHAAAQVDIRSSRKDLEKINIEGTKNILRFASLIDSKIPLKRFSYISTAYVSGTLSGTIIEDFNKPKAFSSIYEETKYSAELETAKFFDNFPINIIRPTQIIGDQNTGYIQKFNTVYYPIKLYMTKNLWLIPVSGKTKIDMVPVDHVAKTIIDLSLNNNSDKKIFHICASNQNIQTLKEILMFTRDWAKRVKDISLSRPFFIRVPFINLIGRTYNMFQHKKKGSMLKNILSLTPYASTKKTYSDHNTKSIIKTSPQPWDKYFHKLLEYAVYMGFLDFNERTVFEQHIYRLKSKKYPVTYHNISNGVTEDIRGALLIPEIKKIVSALLGIGVKKGTRAAIIGNCSTRYISIDTALGLIGAISVPLYFSTPVKDIEKYLDTGNCELIFIGNEEILKNLKLSNENIKVISMFDGSKIYFSWSDFIAKGNEIQDFSHRANFRDIATIRYTSGTTSRPKGVVFNNHHLRWMAISTASLLKWEIRNKDARVLSFLPMSHVIEGILSAYSSLYNLCKLDIYYLYDFTQLEKTLPKVRPTFFFSVPRIYEKIWEKFSNTKTGSFYIDLRYPRLKKALSPIIRYLLLKKCGLVKCRQIVVGAAPININIQKNFSELGIEILNAYGLTEAPLVSMNRPGDNRIGTVGELLPETTISFGDDGEIMIKGPQVMCRYNNEDRSICFDNGYFKTGDLGVLSEDERLIINGRKKDIIITSYGKNIFPFKIECLLNEISGVCNAILVGDSYPYCCAVLWADDLISQNHSSEYYAKSINLINQTLSNPERIKKWAVVNRQLTINSGELTPSFKIKRDTLTANYRDLITAFYSDSKFPDYVINSSNDMS